MIATGQFSVARVRDGAKGDKGDKGDSGISVAGVSREYTVSTSYSELINPDWTDPYTPEWSTTEPSNIDATHYLWERIKTTLSDGSITYSSAVCQRTISGILSDVDNVKGQITNKVWQSDISTSINSYDSSTVSTIRDRVTTTEQNLTGITTRVSAVESTSGSLGTRMTAAESSISQNADKISLVVDSNSSSSSLILTDNAISAMTNQFVIKDPTGNSTIISGGRIHVDAIKSTNYVAPTTNATVAQGDIPTEPYSVSGSFLNLSNGNFITPNFVLDNTNGDAYFSGAVNATALHVGNSNSSNHLIYENNTIDLRTDWLRFDDYTDTVIIGENDNNVVNIKPRYMSMTNDVGIDYLKIGDNRYYDDDLNMWVSQFTENRFLEKTVDDEYYIPAFYHPVVIISIIDATTGEEVIEHTINGNNIFISPEQCEEGTEYTITYLTDSLNCCFLLGNNITTEDAVYPIAFGLGCIVKEKFSFAKGTYSSAIGAYSYASGYRSVADGSYSIANGYYAKTDAYAAISIGGNCESYGSYSVSIGYCASTNKMYSLAFGNNTKAFGRYSMSYGNNTQTNDYYSIAFGYYSESNSSYSVSIGDTTKANNEYSIALGRMTTSSGKYSIANGYESLSVANYSIASGYMAEANKGFSTALGYKTKANGDYSIALGYCSIASGFDSFARGLNSQATNNHSFASGYYCLASGDSSVAQNLKTIATIEGQTVIGKYNAITKDYLSIICSPDVICGDDTIVDGTAYVPNSGDYAFVIGNGFSEDDRSNALTVDWDGKITSYSTNITVGSSPSSNTYNPAYILADRNGTRTGWLQQAQYTDGRIGTRVETVRTVNGSDVAHGFCQLIDDSGNRTVTFSDNAAWRTGLGLSHILDMVRVTEFKKANITINANTTTTVEIDYTIPAGFDNGRSITWRVDTTGTTSGANPS